MLAAAFFCMNDESFNGAKSRFVGVGMMSGTSLDGLDLAAVEFVYENERWTARILAAETVEYDAAWRQRLSAPPPGAEEYAKLNVDYGHWQGMHCRRFILLNGLKPDFAAAHGHTVFHRPHRHFTAQIGDGETTATHLPCAFVTGFRNKDVALGGEGAPLVPFGETALFPEYSAFLNLGGIANLTLVGVEGFAHRRHLAAFDVCACNLALNALAARMDMAYDKDGETAASGRLLPEVLESLENLAFYRLPAPRSLGREWVEAEIFPLLSENLPPQDLMHTVCVHIAERVAAEYERYGRPGNGVMTTGGGAFHKFLIRMLSEKIPVVLPDKLWIEYKEAALFAFLGLMRLLGRPNVLHAGTGARKAAVSGSVHYPEG